MIPYSWVESANDPSADFPLHNLPYGVFDRGEGARIGVAIGDQILDLREVAADVPSPALVQACTATSLNSFMSLGPGHWTALRNWITERLRAGAATRPLIPMTDVTMKFPVEIGDYTDFFTSLYHATNAGKIFHPDQPVRPNYKHMPIGYHSRASSVVLSGTPVQRPYGQTKPPTVNQPSFGPCRLLDYELEVGFFAGPGNALGKPVSIDAAPSRIFGACLLNDWSGRDIQFWESQPLGPFLSKSFCTSISPWIVPMAALEPFRIPVFPRPAGDPAPLAHLHSREEQQRGGIDLNLEVYLFTPRMRSVGASPMCLTRGNFRDMYWTVAQMLTHHTSNGCNLRPGDLLGSGTVSGGTPDSLGCLLELTRAGTEAIHLPNGEERRFLEDGDEVILRGYCERGEPGSAEHLRIGFGECRGVILPA